MGEGGREESNVEMEGWEKEGGKEEGERDGRE